MPLKDPAQLNRVILKNGGVIEREDGTDIISVNAAGTVTSITGTETIIATEIVLANNKALVGDVTGFGSAKTIGVTSSAPTLTGASGTTSSDTGGTPAGTNSAPVFTGTSPVSSLDLATPAFSGTGLTAAGQVMTTTDNQTMTLNQCAGMWLIPATGATPPMLILSNTAVTTAPAVLTVQGAAATDAGAYKIVKSLTPVGTVAAPTFTGSALAGHTHTVTPTGTVSAPINTVAYS